MAGTAGGGLCSAAVSGPILCSWLKVGTAGEVEYPSEPSLSLWEPMLSMVWEVG